MNVIVFFCSIAFAIVIFPFKTLGASDAAPA
jgi:hypothetical protein